MLDILYITLDRYNKIIKNKTLTHNEISKIQSMQTKILEKIADLSQNYIQYEKNYGKYTKKSHLI